MNETVIPCARSTSTSYPRSASSAQAWIISSVTGTPSMVST